MNLKIKLFFCALKCKIIIMYRLFTQIKLLFLTFWDKKSVVFAKTKNFIVFLPIDFKMKLL